jgi:hypothetical protein
MGKRGAPGPPEGLGGGVRQRLARLGLTPARHEESRLVRHLLREVAWGRLSSIAAQKIAAAASVDMESAIVNGEVHPRIKQLARAGQNGEHSGNCFRDVSKMWPNMALPDAMADIKPTCTYWEGTAKKTSEVAWCNKTCVSLQATRAELMPRSLSTLAM